MSPQPSSRPHTRDRRIPATPLDSSIRASDEPGAVQRQLPIFCSLRSSWV
jgi:hypothetical protein